MLMALSALALSILAQSSSTGSVDPRAIISPALHSEGWRLETPPTPPLEKFEMCRPDTGDVPSCRLSCIQPPSRARPGRPRRAGASPRAKRTGFGRRLQTAANATMRMCDRCECQLCAACSKPANLWTSPSGQAIETITTRTEPRFTFAYNPYDDDMARMRKTMILEPMLTHAWHEATARCCNETGGLVIDVGGNFGWYTLYSLALGCRVAVFEPVPAYQEVMRLGLSLNPGFAERTTLYGNVVYDQPGNYTLRVPRPAAIGRKKKLGMTGMDGSSGILKADWKADSYNVLAGSVRIDDMVTPSTPVCMLKADVEGYEPQVLQTARKLLTTRRVPALQLELTRTPKSRNQTCAAYKMLAHLADLGYDFKQVNNRIVDREAPRVGSWAKSEGPWNKLPDFPSEATRQSAQRVHRLGLVKSGTVRNAAMTSAYRKDFVSFSTNLIAMQSGAVKSCGGLTGLLRRCPQSWPELNC